MVAFLSTIWIRLVAFFTYLLLFVFAGFYQAQQKPQRSLPPFQPRINPGVVGSHPPQPSSSSSSSGLRSPSIQSLGFGSRLGPGVSDSIFEARNSGSQFAARHAGMAHGGGGGQQHTQLQAPPQSGLAHGGTGRVPQDYARNGMSTQFQFGGNGGGGQNQDTGIAQPYDYQQQIPLESTYALCGGHIWLQDSGPRPVMSPNYPGNYPNDTYCEWRIYAGFGTQLRINATDFALESSETCKSDYIQFYWANGTPSTWNVKRGEVERFCGTEGPLDLVFKDNNLVMTLVTDRSRTNRGFNISFTIFETCAILYDQPNFRGTSTTLEQFYESSVWPSQSDNVFLSVEISEGCKLMVCSDDHFEGTCHLFFRTNRNISPLYINWPRSASCICS
ncbi:hypothetical protein BV898_02371 [Hypsibius exemplaris]|uniref:CUB domain-containing protein n=1 Tax=Hypsibius exemplaris TaxID=2072580 RepID=A0A1W0X8A1_HYPEX|nr:hypothetical protein BV898_02371 [Hypsibius exemplaris]